MAPSGAKFFWKYAVSAYEIMRNIRYAFIDRIYMYVPHDFIILCNLSYM